MSTGLRGRHGAPTTRNRRVIGSGVGALFHYGLQCRQLVLVTFPAADGAMYTGCLTWVVLGVLTDLFVLWNARQSSWNGRLHAVSNWRMPVSLSVTRSS